MTLLNHAAWAVSRQTELERALDVWLQVDPQDDPGHPAPARLLQVMRYAVLDGGKRLRPLLVFAAFEDCAAAPVAACPEGVLRAAGAVELIHAYSLVHDDMPCMDNDVLRRGKPTVHVAHGEASALLAGDALQALAFAWLTPDESVLALPVQARLCGLLARAAGSGGMAGGQAIDLDSVGLQLDEPGLARMHSLKTGALLQASVLMGACCAGASSLQWAALAQFGVCIGLAFQVVDDILDVTADTVVLGKTAGKDAAASKPTYVSVLGLAGARQRADALLTQALAALDQLGPDSCPRLRALAQRLVQRPA